jgi:hypothetical protein
MSEVDLKFQESGTKGEQFGHIMAGAGLMAAGAVTGLVAFGLEAVHHAEEAGQAAYEMSEKFGLTAERASLYLSAGRQIGLTNEQVSKGFQFLAKNVGAMQITLDATGKISATTGQVYKELGINVMDTGGKVKDADTLMMEAADAFKGMEDGVLKTDLAIKLFGKSGTDLLPMLNQGRSGIEAMMVSGKAMGDSMSGPQAKAAHELMLAHKQVDTQISGLTTSIGTALIPIAIALIPVVQSVISSFSHTQAVVTALQPWFPLIAAGLVVLGGVMATILIPMFIAWTVATWAQVVALTAQAVAMIAAYWPILLIIVAIAAVVAVVILVVQHWDFLKAKTLEVWSTIKAHVLDIVEWFKGLPGSFLTMAEGIGTSIVNGIVSGIRRLAGAVIGAIKDLLPGGADGPVAKGLHIAGIPGFQFGGTVPGAYSGQPQLILAHAGETVTPEGQQPAGGQDIGALTALLQEIADSHARAVALLEQINSTTPRGAMLVTQRIGG